MTGGNNSSGGRVFNLLSGDTFSAFGSAQGGKSINSTDLTPGPVEETLDMDPLDVGSYYFQCDAHPTTMFGALAVVKGAK